MSHNCPIEQYALGNELAVIEKRISKNGMVSYRVKIRRKGFPTLTATFDKKTAAKEWITTKENEIRRARQFGEETAFEKTVSEVLERYRSEELPKKSAGREYFDYRLRWWERELGDLKLSEISPIKLAACRERLLRTSPSGGSTREFMSPQTVRHYMNAFSRVLTIASRDWGWIATNPMTKVAKPSVSNGRVRFLDDSERNCLLDACRSSSSDYLYAIVIIALSTGARKGEIMNLRWRDIDLERGLARLEKTKNNERRAIPLTHSALSELKSLHAAKSPEPKEFVFARSDGLAPMEIKKHWLKALDDAGIEDFRFHDLRHTAASYLAMNGATLAEIAEVLGHKTLQMVKRYAHLTDQHTASVVERMNAKYFAANDNEEQANAEQRKTADNKKQ